MGYRSFIPIGWGVSVITSRVYKCYTSNWLLSCYVLYSLIKVFISFQNVCKPFGPCWMISWMSWLIFGCFHTHVLLKEMSHQDEWTLSTDWSSAKVNNKPTKSAFPSAGLPVDWGRISYTYTDALKSQWIERRGKLQGWGDPDTANQIVLDWKGWGKLEDRKCRKNASS